MNIILEKATDVVIAANKKKNCSIGSIYNSLKLAKDFLTKVAVNMAIKKSMFYSHLTWTETG